MNILGAIIVGVIIVSAILGCLGWLFEWGGEDEWRFFE